MANSSGGDSRVSLFEKIDAARLHVVHAADHLELSFLNQPAESLALLLDLADHASNMVAVHGVDDSLPVVRLQFRPCLQTARRDRLLNPAEDRVEVRAAGCPGRGGRPKEGLNGHPHDGTVAVAHDQNEFGSGDDAGVFQAAQHAAAEQIPGHPRRRCRPVRHRKSSRRACANWRR